MTKLARFTCHEVYCFSSSNYAVLDYTVPQFHHFQSPGIYASIVAHKVVESIVSAICYT